MAVGPAEKRSAKGSFLSAAAGVARAVLTFPDPHIGWYRPALDAGRVLLKDQQFDAIVSTAWPVTAHLVAARLKREFGIPWVADLRDLWSQNHYLTNPQVRRLHRALERRVLSTADALTTVSEPLAEQLRCLHRKVHVHTVLNGYDPDEFLLHRSDPPINSRFTVAYMGSLYQGKRDPSLLFRAIQELIAEGTLTPEDISVDFYGDSEQAWLNDRIRRYELQEVVHVRGRVSRSDSLALQRSADLLLLLLWDNPQERGTVPGKLFEYLASCRPILACGGPTGVVADLLSTTHAGRFAATLSELKEYLTQSVTRWRSHGALPSATNLGQLSRYSHREMARSFAQVLSGVALLKGSNGR